MNKKAIYAVLVLTSLAAGASGWYFLRSSAGGGGVGYPFLCPHCDHFFSLDEDQVYTHPKSPTGEGFQCPKCGRFGARIAARCDQCGQWVIMQQGPGGASYCPKCPRGVGTSRRDSSRDAERTDSAQPPAYE